MKKTNAIGIFLFAIMFFFMIAALDPPVASAQVGYNPEFLGNAAGPPRPGFSPKIFFDYFNQSSVGGDDVEIALEPQYWIRGFTGSIEQDYIQFLAHLPFGYRSQNDHGTRNPGWGIGTLNANVEHFWKLIDDENSTWWFDNGLSAGFPTASGKDGLRIGGNSYSVTWFQENFFKLDRWIFSISPISVSWTFRDSKNKTTPGLSLNVMNSAYGYQVTDMLALGVTTACQLGNLVGTSDGIGGRLPKSRRIYVGPAFLFAFKHDMSLQISGLIDVNTKNVNRGQGISVAFWHMF